MKTFIEQWKASVIDGAWYKDIVAGKVPLRIRYAFGMALISALVLSVSFGVALYTKLLPEFKAFISTSMPGDLIVTMKSGELSINKPVPYKLPLGEQEKVSGKENFLVIDTSVEATLKSTDVYKTVMFSSGKMIVTEKENGEIRAQSYKDFPDFVMTKEKMLGYIETALSFAWILPIGTAFFIALFMFVQILFLCLLAACLLWVLCKIASKEATFKNLFTASMYAYTVIFSANVVLSIFGMRTFPFGASIVITVLVAVFFIFMSKKDGTLTDSQNSVV